MTKTTDTAVSTARALKAKIATLNQRKGELLTELDGRRQKRQQLARTPVAAKHVKAVILRGIDLEAEEFARKANWPAAINKIAFPSGLRPVGDGQSTRNPGALNWADLCELQSGGIEAYRRVLDTDTMGFIPGEKWEPALLYFLFSAEFKARIAATFDRCFSVPQSAKSFEEVTASIEEFDAEVDQLRAELEGIEAQLLEIQETFGHYGVTRA